jgi:hypothetical protein
MGIVDARLFQENNASEAAAHYGYCTDNLFRTWR